MRLSDVREVWSLAWPTVVTMTSYTMMQFVDSLMVSVLGPVEVAAQGNGGMWSWVAISIAFGILALVNTLVAQRATGNLFDTQRVCRHLESAFITMIDTLEQGKPPKSFSVAAETESG